MSSGTGSRMNPSLIMRQSGRQMTSNEFGLLPFKAARLCPQWRMLRYDLWIRSL